MHETTKLQRREALPSVVQRSLFDCGPAALQVVARLFELRKAPEILDQVPAPEEPISIAELRKIAKQAGLHTAALRVNFETLVEYVAFPCIVHWRDAHYVVVLDADDSGVCLFDPAVGAETMCPVTVFLSRWARLEGGEGAVIAIERPEKSE